MEQNKKVHFMGIGGAGLSAVAALAEAFGWEISGCDLDSNSPFLESLKRKGLIFYNQHSSSHLENTNLLAISPAIESLNAENEEVRIAREKDIPVLIGEEFLAKYLILDKKVIAIAGTHGKSTTTAMVSQVLTEAGLDPVCLVGAIVNDWGKNYRVGKGGYFIIEADEFQEKFLLYSPFIAVITAVEMDHPEYFKDLAAVRSAFEKFAGQVKEKGYLVLGRNTNIKAGPRNKVAFTERKFNLRVIGKFNEDNASLAFEVGKLLKIDEEAVRGSLEKFNGVGRRFEFKGEEKGIKVFEDYAHHPTAIKVTTEAVKENFPGSRVWIIYQPHLFTRTFVLKKDFIDTFNSLSADFVILADIYAAREENKFGISSSDLAKEINKENVKYVGDFEKIALYLAERAVSNDIILVMGAGDIYKLTPLILKKIAKRI